MAEIADAPLTLKLSGSPVPTPEMPALLRAGTVRGGPPGADPFLPEGYLRVGAAFDLSTVGRSAPTAVTDVELGVAPGQVLVLELPDGSTLITSGDRLAEELRRVAPDAVTTRTLELDAVQARGAASRGLLDSLGRLVAKVFVLDCAAAPDAIVEEALGKVREWAGEKLADRLRQGGKWGGSYFATRALMWAIERRLLREPGLYGWVGAKKVAGDLHPVDARQLAEAARQGPLLVFIHGTGSSTTGSFGDLRAMGREAQLDWDLIEGRYGGRVFGFEHRTFSESPIENALMLARALPAGAQVDLVTHSRGGIVGDLLCVDWSDAEATQPLIDGYARFRRPDEDDTTDLEQADAKDRRDLLALAAEWRDKRFKVGRYVRVAAPVNGTLLAGSNLDLFLSLFLTLFGLVTTLQATPHYLALRRIVLEIARHRADANRVPGIEAMLPGSAVSRLLRLGAPQAGVSLGVIAGDIEGAPRFRRLVQFLADWAIFERTDNDLVVDTASMDAGIARPANARRLLVQGAQVDHFSYFGNADSRAALAGWLSASTLDAVPGFDAIARELVEPGRVDEPPAARGAEPPRPVVIVLPGIMGSHLQAGGDRIWFDPLDIARGRLARIRYAPDSLAKVTPEALFDRFYGDLCRHLGATHRVVRHPYDWRRPVQDAAQALAQVLRDALAATRDAQLPVRILAHSMGGLVTRALAAAEPALWDEFLARDGARFVMLGTPNQGSHLMVEMLLGKGDTVRKLAMLDARHDLQEILDLIAGFRGALQLLPAPRFTDAGGPSIGDYLQPSVWESLRSRVADFWFGDGKVGVPKADACAEAGALWSLPGFAAPGVPGGRPDKVLYVCGKADNTACGLDLGSGRVKMIGTPEGDGSVSWASGRIAGIGEAYLMNAAHGDLAATEEHFDALVELLTQGVTGQLPRGWPSAAARGVPAPAGVIYDAGPTAIPTDDELARSLLGASARPRALRRRDGSARLQVSCAAMDLRYATAPILVGHYEQDPITGAEAIIDRDVVGNELTMRQHLGLYPGPIGTAAAVLVDANEEERQRGSQRGALVAGLGKYGELTVASLTEAVRAAALRYLLSVVERRGAVGTAARADEPPIEIELASLLLGQNSTANIGVADSVHALVRGVLEANRQFDQAQQRGVKARIVRLEIIERYLDLAISAARALQGIVRTLEADAAQLGMRVEAVADLLQGCGARPRLEAPGGAGYWPRLTVTGVDDLRGSSGSAGSADAPVRSTLRAPVAGMLNYQFLGQRARAEAQVVQRQPGLIESLVKLSVDQPVYNRDLSRTLFQLMVPLDLKEAARQTSTLAVLVDEHTANFPWELLCADDAPLVTTTAMVRQFVTTSWRRHLRSTVDRTAYVVGNPSTHGFAKAFPSKANKGELDPRPLPGAETEAHAVAAVLRAAGYDPVESIGADQRAVDVINRLFQKPYRILHIAAHGEFDIEAAEGGRRSGVLLSDGLMLTAAEIQQMEFVPDLVFLNCCHLGQIDGRSVSRGVEYHRLASSLARELIDMGVRAVVVAGWAVDDQAAHRFAEAFYRALMHDGRTFGLAVHQARCETYRAFPSSNTWGAFQAYGDPGFRLDPSRPSGSGANGAPGFVAPQELIDEIEQIREGQRRVASPGSKRTLAGLQRDIDRLLGRCPKGSTWTERGDVLFAVGMAYAELGPAGFERACDHLLRAIEADEQAERTPIKAIEQLANLEVRNGVAKGDVAAIERGGERIRLLAATVSARPGDPASLPTAERCALIGGAWKRRALALAREGKPFRAELTSARDWYGRGIGVAATRGFSPYCALNRVLLDGLLDGAGDVELARVAGAAARERFRATRDYWDAIMPADAHLAEALAAGALVDRARAAATIDDLVASYRNARSAVAEDAKSWDSVVQQIDLLADFAAAQGDAALADGLGALAGRLRPGGDAGRGRRATAAASPGPGPAGGSQAQPKAGGRPRKKAAPRRKSP